MDLLNENKENSNSNSPSSSATNIIDNSITKSLYLKTMREPPERKSTKQKQYMAKSPDDDDLYAAFVPRSKDSSSWRNESNKIDGTKQSFKSSGLRGISPQSFHQSTTPKKASIKTITNDNTPSKKKTPSKLNQILAQAKERELQNEFQHYYQLYKLQLAAFRDVTSYRVWPLQELALKDLDCLIKNYRGESDGKETDRQSGYELESGSSGSSIDEPKRRKEVGSISNTSGSDTENMGKKELSIMTSPGRSTIRYKLRQDFLAKMRSTCSIPPNPSSLKDEDRQREFLTPLWALEPRIFAVEKSGTGKRKYIVCNLGRFMDHYWRKCELFASKHYYELIRENTPCRLYFGELICITVFDAKYLACYWFSCACIIISPKH